MSSFSGKVMRRFWFAFSVCLFGIIALQDAAAQSASDLLAEGTAAFREGRYEEAARAFERATERDPQNAQAYFLLARVYSETPLEDRRKANRALDRALELEPDNLSFLVGRLQQLRAESWNFFSERIREVKRVELARKILRLDSTNAFAHEELGRTYIRDFWRYRNAIMLPTLRFTTRNMAARTSDIDLGTMSLEDQAGLFLDPEDPLSGDQSSTQGIAPSDPVFFDPNEVFQADRFDIEQLKQQGVPVQDLSRRAQRAYERAIGHLEKALEADPRRRSVYDDMMQIYALKGEYVAALETLEDMYAFFPEEADTWLYLGLAHYREGNMDAAQKSFETAFAYMTEEETAAFSSLDYLLADDEKPAYEQDPVAYASRFWTSKDPRFLTPYNERKLEHYARLVYADLLYGSDDLNLRGWDTQRGHILVRYGLPNSDVVLLPSNTSMAAKDVVNRSLAQQSGGNNPAQAQTSATDPGAYQRRLLLEKGSGFDIAAEANTFNIWDYGDFRFVFEDPFRNGEYRLYSPSAADISDGVHPWLNDYAMRARETFREVPERYEYEAPGRQIDLPYLVTSFKGEGRETDVYVHYGIPLTERPNGEMINLTANVGAFLISDEHDILVERRRTVYGLKASNVQAFKETSLWVDTQQMSAPPGEHEVSMEFETASGSTVAVQRRAVEVPDFATDRLALSDIMLAYHVEEAADEAEEGALVRRGLSITPAPWSVFSNDQPIYLYFEVYNLARTEEGRTDYAMEALLVPKDDAKGIAKLFKGIFGGEKGVAVTLPGSGTATDEGQYLIMDATDQPEGLYTLLLRIRDNVSGKTVERQQDLFLE